MKRLWGATAVAMGLVMALPAPSWKEGRPGLRYPAAEAKVLERAAAFLFARFLIRLAWRGVGKAAERAIIRRVSAYAHDPRSIRLIVESLEQIMGQGGHQAAAARNVLQILRKMPLNRANPYAIKVPVPGQMVNASNFWTRYVNFGRMRVYQGRDIFDPSAVHGGLSNLQRMQKGRAPIGVDGKPVQLHHMLQKDGEAIAEIAESLHKGFHDVLHINPGSIPSGISRSEFDAWRSAYWRSRAKDLSGGLIP